MELHSRVAAILLLGSAWSPSRYRQVIERSSGASPNAAIATFACSSCRPLASFCCDQGTGWSTALDLGLPLRLNAYTIMCWRQLWLTSWPASHGACWHNIVYTRRVSAQQRYDMSSLWFTKGMTATLLRHRRSPIGASERRWLRRDGFSQS